MSVPENCCAICFFARGSRCSCSCGGVHHGGAPGFAGSKTVNKEFADRKPFARYSCSQCGHSWEGRPYRAKGYNKERYNDYGPFKCPRCGSRYWYLRTATQRESDFINE